LSVLSQNNATEVLAKMLMRVCRSVDKGKQRPVLSTHSVVCTFWILSALAAKGNVWPGTNLREEDTTWAEFSTLDMGIRFHHCTSFVTEKLPDLK
jgi:hypothetical protein